MKFTTQGSIEFGYRQSDAETIRFHVKDSGIGIKPEFHEKIFHRFHQIEQPDFMNPTGMGLGLSICKGIVEGLGGKIGLTSALGEGSEFYFNIPYQPVEPEQIDIITSKPTAITDVLIVDDETANLLFLEELLSSFKSIKIHKATNGQEAVDYCLQNYNIRMVFMDMRMPVMNGDEATRRIKQINPDIIIIAQSAYTTNEDIAKALDAGCDDYISKPISSNKLFDLINNIIRSDVR
ncbi:MAG: response regulator [Chloroflexia bacterium]|nr:response regulator [Chloroflexia bacterium]